MTALVSLLTRPAGRLAGAAVVAAAVTVTVAPAYAGTSGPSTLRAQISSDGSVTSARMLGFGSSSDFTGKLPISISISRTTSGDSQTYRFHVENTFSQTRTVNYLDTAGNPLHTSVVVQLPLVAQLGVDLPSSMSGISAPGASVTSDPDGTRHLLWNMVLFSPLGSAAQDVSLTATGAGTPVTELRAAVVDPTTAPGLSSAAQSATVDYQQDDFWKSYAQGGNGGLAQLSDGTQKLVVGLVQLLSGATQLHDGIAGAQGGATKLDAGTKKAYVGSQQLRAGLRKIHAGLANTPTALTGGMRLIETGLNTLADKKLGLPAAVDGVKQLQAGVAAALKGVGDDTTNKTLINGIDRISGGLAQAIVGVQTQLEGSLSCLSDVEGGIVNGASSATLTNDPCYQLIDVSLFEVQVAPGVFILPGAQAIDPSFATNPLYPVLVGLQQVTAGFVTGTNATLNDPRPKVGLVAGLTKLKSGADAIRFGLSHPAGALGATDPGGLKEGLTLINGGLLQLLDKQKGLPAAVSGVDQLAAGSSKELGGLKKELSGTGSAYAGVRALAAGLGKLSAGQHKVATGLPAAVDGSGQIATGLAQVLTGTEQVHGGLGQTKSGATGPLNRQLSAASQNAHKQLAILQAAAALGSDAPGGPSTTYVLTQRNTASLSASPAASSSHTARNVGLGIGGGVLLLLAGWAAGYFLGRRPQTAG